MQFALRLGAFITFAGIVASGLLSRQIARRKQSNFVRPAELVSSQPTHLCVDCDEAVSLGVDGKCELCDKDNLIVL